MQNKMITVDVLAEEFTEVTTSRPPSPQGEGPRVRLWLCLVVITLTVISSSCKHKESETHTHDVSEGKQLYTCSMHPQIIRDKPGKCPICGMDLVKKENNAQKITDIQLEDLLKPTNEFVITTVPVTTIKRSSVEIPIEALGNIQNDTRQLATISSRVAGRIERLYVRYRYQMVMPGDKIMDIYSPEIATAQQNLLFLLKSDASNTSLIEAAKQRLLLMGMSNQQVQQLIRTRKATLTISVYSNAMGHVHEAGQEAMDASGQMQSTSTLTTPLAIREGMYVERGQKIFSLTNPQKAWAVLTIFPENQHLVKPGNPVKITPEAMPQKAFRARINFIEPFFRQGNKTLTARAYFDNADLGIPIGSQVRANIYGSSANANWLPQEAVVSLGLNDVAFVKTTGGFVARKVQTGIKQNKLVQIINGLEATDTLAANAQFLTDSESFIKVKQ
ncbi:MAG: efflux transporter, family, subunit [Segetibacter sp.]|nr:efflux transporter, family, subunit [Segetibacter sp.]